MVKVKKGKDNNQVKEKDNLKMVKEKGNLKMVKEKGNLKMVKVRDNLKTVREKEMDKENLVQTVGEQEMKVEKILLENHPMALMVKTHQKMASHLTLGLKNKFSKIWKMEQVSILTNTSVMMFQRI
jgi:hypothetical protein